ncbi:C4-type zinc ribbon domain-containing protein [uncultured Paludibaculum sp.]|uniref:zinc ribbon domain-containing protein n=1 Tax=uncultured Paludibaculum sp. TaxID=1765020 RepID=UPI002AAC3B3F|nr:C4-type zinc ribbon domain-containing protein [uncultured Paludibaculum sp.]
MSELRREIATLPKQIAQIEKTLEAHNRRLELDKAAQAANQRDRKKIDSDISGHQQKISKLRDQMLGAKTNDQYRAFQHEIEFCEESIRKCEDQILELMSSSEALEQNVKKAEAALAQERKVVDSQKLKAKARTEADQQELKKLDVDRAEVAKTLPANTLVIYDRLRTRYYKDGDVIAEAKDGLCTKCMMALRPQFFQEVKLSTTLTFCENCRRIIYYEEPAADVEAQMNG